MKAPIEELFKYHPPKTAERIAKHDLINKLALDLAKAVDESVQDETTKQYAIFAIQQARMFANQGITFDELNNNYAN